MFNLVDGGFLIFIAALAVTAGLVFLIKIGLTKLLHPVRKTKVQVAGVERPDLSVNANARKLTSMPTSGKDVTPVMSNGGMTSANLAHAMVDNVFYTFYQLEKNNQKLKLKIPANIGTNMAKPGDIGYVTYQDGVILSFERIGNVNDN